MLEIYLVRHGQTLFNEKDMVQGVCDSPLTKLGQKQAQNVASHLRQVAFTQWFSSPSLRAVDTGEAINAYHHLQPKLDRRLMEMNFGSYEGDKNAVLWEDRNMPFEKILEVGWVDAGGENEAMVASRITSFFDELTATYQDEVILVTGHGMWLKQALGMLNQDAQMASRMAKEGLGNGSVSMVTYTPEAGYVIHFFNDTTMAKEEV